MPRPWVLAFALMVGSTTSRAGDDLDFFESRVRPVLVGRCEKCHGAEKHKGGLRLDSKAGWSRGGDRGPAIVPGKPEESLVIQAIRHADDDLAMPPEPAAKLADREVADLVEWVRRGAPDPRENGSGRLGGMSLDEAKRWWSLQPVKRHDVPAGKNPIDAFLDARIASAGLPTAPLADKRTLIRRATYDLTGLPPTFAEVQAFVRDDSPEAFARVVDRLLASPQYGERWGRHWLDLVRYADTAGENSDHPLPHAWRYRNWVVAAFNRDMPYDEFVRQQIAGDLMAKDLPAGEAADRTVATGYLAVSRRFGNEIDKDVHLTIEDAIDTTGKAFLGLTIACARCHNHKYDPISAEDYYALYGILASTRLPYPGCEPTPLPRDLVTLPSGETAYAVAEGKSGDAKMHLRGDPEKLGANVPRRWLEVLGGQKIPSDGGSGRLALAGWLTSPDNPLTARVIVNRIWAGHFDRGLVSTPSDFGSRGSPPSHPELLDWLASEFMASGWRIKPMHRLMMLSDAYRRGGGPAADTDPDNASLARFGRRRLTAEEVRDSLLVAADHLDRSPGTAFPFPPEKDWHYTQHAPFASFYPSERRSLYLVVVRNQRDPFFSLFDGADPNTSTPSRQDTTVPTQALYFLNSPFVHEQSERVAARVAGRSDAERIDRLFMILLQRMPSPSERVRAERFLAEYVREVNGPGRAKVAWAALSRVLIGGNEFLYLD
jgi:Protein of unknown function (DUF1553)/Protein of unknown function (DUF1549)/Planctomycete cytochrome C